VPFASSGWVQHINYYNEESSAQGSLNIKVPFLQWNDREGYIKTGMFVDSLSRTYDQNTYTNSGDTNTSFVGEWNDPWSAVFPDEDHPIFASNQDVPYNGSQLIAAGYGMADLPINETMNIVGGMRYETTSMSTTVSTTADAGAFGIDPNDPTQTPIFVRGNALFDSSIDQVDWLPMIGLNWNLMEQLVLRLSYAQTLARPNFFEIVPVVQYEYVGGPIFIGNPQLQMSSLENYDARLDWTPEEGWLISGSVFYKTIDKPIQYAQRFASFGEYTSAYNFPNATLFGVEIETRVTLEPLLGEDLKGLAVGGNFTLMNSSVTLPQQDITAFQAYGVSVDSVPMTGTPDYLFNANVTYDYEPLGTQIGLFYNYQGKSLISAPAPTLLELSPSIYQMPYGTLNFTLRQPLLWGFAANFAAKNLTNPARETQYETTDGFTGLNSTYTAGIDLQFGLSFQMLF
jgi:TonB-dependent receptor